MKKIWVADIQKVINQREGRERKIDTYAQTKFG